MTVLVTDSDPLCSLHLCWSSYSHIFILWPGRLGSKIRHLQVCISCSGALLCFEGVWSADITWRSPCKGVKSSPPLCGCLEMELRDVEWLFWDHTVRQRQSWDSYTGFRGFKFGPVNSWGGVVSGKLIGNWGPAKASKLREGLQW